MPVAYINIGSNQGDSRAVIEHAIALIEQYTSSKTLRSNYITTPPWGFKSSSDFLNIGISLNWADSPDALFDILQSVERQISDSPHRDSYGNYIDRLIDIDLIAFDDIIMDSPRITLPHPRMHLRAFVLIPMIELAPQWSHPILNATAQELLEKLEC